MLFMERKSETNIQKVPLLFSFLIISLLKFIADIDETSLEDEEVNRALYGEEDEDSRPEGFFSILIFNKYLYSSS